MWAAASEHLPSSACPTKRFLPLHNSRALSSSNLELATPIVWKRNALNELPRLRTVKLALYNWDVFPKN